VAFKALDESLISSNRTIQDATEGYRNLEEKLSSPRTKEKAEVWDPRATTIRELSKEVLIYIDGLRSDLKAEAGLEVVNGVGSYKIADKNAVTKIFIKKKFAEDLYKHLKEYQSNVLAVDSGLLKEFVKPLVLTTSSFDADPTRSFGKTFFEDMTTVGALAMLSKFQNNVRIIENKTIEFCGNQMTSIRDYYTVYLGFAAINSSYVKAGEKLEITAGVGAFTNTAAPHIIINGKDSPLEPDGAAHFRFKAPDKPGQHNVHVEIIYIDEDGQKKAIIKEVPYTVADN
jgi:hypothetical protein